MPEAVAQEARKQPAVPELIRNPKAALQEAKGRLGSLIESSNAGLTELDHLLERVSKEDWTRAICSVVIMVAACAHEDREVVSRRYSNRRVTSATAGGLRLEPSSP